MYMLAKKNIIAPQFQKQQSHDEYDSR